MIARIVVTVARKHPLAECEKCPLAKNKVCFSDGPEKADLVIVGEAPGFREVGENRPFTGPSGALLDEVLKHHDIDREEVFVTNTVLCRPKGNGDPPPEAVAACSTRLRSEIESRSPKTIVTVGNFATRAVLGKKAPITKARVGPPKESHLYPGIDIVPTWHPAAVLRSTMLWDDIVTDIGKVKQGVHVLWEPPKYKVFDTDSQARTALIQLQQRGGPVVLDIETSRDKDEDKGERFSTLLCVGLAYDDGKSIVIGENAVRSRAVLEELSKLLKSVPTIAQNGKYDLGTLTSIGVPTGELFYDTMLASYALDERSGVHSLSYQGREFLGTPDWKHVMDPYRKDYGQAPRDILYKYNAYDTAVTWDLWKYQEPLLEKKDLRRLHDHLVSTSDFLMQLELDGVRYDPDALDALDKELSSHIEEQSERLSKWVRNGRSPQQVKKAFEDMGIKTPSTDRKHMERILETLKKVADTNSVAQEGIEFINEMMEFRRRTKLYDTYVKGIRARGINGRIHSTFKLHSTRTGRTSSINPNVQNQPRGSTIRSVFIPDEGNAFIQLDYKNIEGRVVTVLAKSETLREIFNEDRDVHGEIASLVWPNYTKEQRVYAKSVVHGVNYGRTVYGIAEGLGIPVQVAQKLFDAYFAMAPEVKEWQNDIKRKLFVDHEEIISPPFGRRRRFHLITHQNEEDMYKEGLSTTPQAVASDICLVAGKRLQDMGIMVRIPVHDSLLLEAPQEDAEEVARIAQQVMEQTAADIYTDYVPFPVDYAIGPNWGAV